MYVHSSFDRVIVLARSSPQAATIAALVLGWSVPASADPAPAKTKTFVCTSPGFVSVCSCPPLDPKKGKLVSIEAVLDGRTDIEVAATAPQTGAKTIQFDVNHTLDLGGIAFYWPGTGSATFNLGPLVPRQPYPTITVKGQATQKHVDSNMLSKFTSKGFSMISSVDIKKPTSPGVDFKSFAKKFSETSFTLTYTYVPLHTGTSKLIQPPIRPLNGTLPGPHDFKPANAKLAGPAQDPDKVQCKQ